MLAPPAGPARPAPVPAVVVETMRLGPADYLALYRRVGTPSRWDARLVMAADALARLLTDPATLLLVLSIDGAQAGFCEFEGLGGAEPELAHFGLVPEV